MSNDIYSIDFTDLLPQPLKDDASTLALAQVVADQLQITANLIKQNIIYPRIDELDEKILDILAYDLHIDWYDYSYSVAEKREVIKNSIQVHRKLGTKYAVETALGNIFPGSKVQEWFEYGGDPYMFKAIIGITSSGLTAEKQTAVLDKVQFYKNIRSHLEAISYKIEKDAAVTVAGFYLMGQRLTIAPLNA